MPGLDRWRRHADARRVLATLAAIGAACLGMACGGGGDTAAPEAVETAPSPASAEITLLMMGNSHTELSQLPQQLQALLSAGLGRSVSAVVAPGWMFLDERSSDAASMALLRSRAWTVVVLQAQKYSSSGLFEYSTAEAEALIRASRAVGAQPLMFPEWPRRGVPETARIYDLHASIASNEAACVAPVGQAFDLALQRFPSLVLHAADGNHSSPAGAYLAALMLYSTLVDGPPLDLPDLPNGVEPAVQAQLRQVAADTVSSVPPRQHCPLDSPLRPQPGSQ